MAKYGPWHEPETEKSPFLAALAHALQMCTRAQATVPYMKVVGSAVMIQGIMPAIHDYAERETRHREYF